MSMPHASASRAPAHTASGHTASDHTAPDHTAPAHASWRPATAQSLRQLATSRRNAGDLASLGMALHHFTDIVSETTDLSAAELHQATGIITKQIREAMAATDPLQVLRRLVTDPHRVATAGGRTVAELCGAGWEAATPSIEAHAVSAVEGARSYGTATMIRLASIHASHATRPWWGTDAWDQLVERWTSNHRRSPLLHSALLRSPERLDLAIVGAVLAA